MLPFFGATDIARELKMHIEKVCTGVGLIAEAATDDMLTLAIYNKVRTSYNMNMQGAGSDSSETGLCRMKSELECTIKYALIYNRSESPFRFQNDSTGRMDFAPVPILMPFQIPDKEIQTQEIPFTSNNTLHESNTIDMHDNDRYTDDS